MFTFLDNKYVKTAIPAIEGGKRGVRVTYIDGSRVFIPIVSF